MGKIPFEAKQEVTEKLLGSMEIYADDVIAILKKYNVHENPEKLQDRYRRALAQRFMASFRDEHGHRAVLAVRDRRGRVKYTILEACKDRTDLQYIQHTLHAQASGLLSTEHTVQNHINALEWLMARFRRRLRA